MKICAVVPAAGRGTRLGLDCPKILVPVNGSKTVWSVLRDLLEPVVDHIHVVVSPSGQEQFEKAVAAAECPVKTSVSVQPSPIGMGDAIFGAQAHWSQYEVILIVWGDQVNLSPHTIKQVATVSRRERTIGLPLTRLVDPYVQYDIENSRLVRVRSAREGDAMDAEGCADVGLFALSVRDLYSHWQEYLPRCEIGSATQEVNFVPFLKFLSSDCRWDLETFFVDDVSEARGINTLDDLAFARSRF